MDLVNRLLFRKIGVDQAILFTGLARIVQAIGGLVVVVLVTKKLTNIEQGYYFTFASILAIQIFFELGFNNILSQYVAHEAINIRLEENEFVGCSTSKSRISSLLHFSVKVYSTLSICLFFVLSLVGYIFFIFCSKDNIVEWRIPWLMLCLMTAIYFFISPFIAFLQGLGKVKEIALMQFIQQCVSVIGLIGTLLLGGKLYAGGIALFLGVLVCTCFVYKRFSKILYAIYRNSVTCVISYKKEIFPFQCKIALSWISSYFIFQLFNPVLFATEGAVVAGQMGMTLSVLNAIMSLSDSWITTKIPLFSGLIAAKEYLKLDRIFKQTMFQSFFINIFVLFLFIFGLYIIDIYKISISGHLLIDRFLPYGLTVMLMFTIVLRQLYGGWAIYLRCHKREPLLIQSVIIAIMCSVSTLFLGAISGINGIVIGYTFLTLCSAVWIYIIFLQKRKKWHYASI